MNIRIFRDEDDDAIHVRSEEISDGHVYVVVLEEYVEWWEIVGVAVSLSDAITMANASLPEGRSWDGEWWSDIDGYRRKIDPDGWMNVQGFDLRVAP